MSRQMLVRLMPDLESVPPELRWPIAAEAIGRTIGRWKWMPPRVAFAVAAVGLGPIALAMLLGVLGSGATGSTLIRAGFVAINLVGLLLAGVFLWNRLRQEMGTMIRYSLERMAMRGRANRSAMP